MVPTAPLRAFLAAAAVALAGCSISVSSESMSASLDSSSKAASSPSASSKSHADDDTAAYRADVRDYTAAYVRTGGDVEAFHTQLARLARSHAIGDWEGAAATWEGVGEGLAKAGVGGAAFESQLTTLTGSDPAKMDAVRSAYERARSR